ncbi:MAG: hypothetical protein K9N00_01935 [Candidatus Marinimicrobia bacterium]|nr:hypothetical protein [Candidatus Neomarinimicrobiota bacterium]
MVKKILLTAATSKEIKILRDLPADKFELDFLITGIGFEKSRTSLKGVNLKDYQAIINVGLAGGLIPEIEKSQIILPSVFYWEGHDKESAVTPSRHLFNKCDWPEIKSTRPLVTTRQVIDGRKKKETILEQFPKAGAVDMEAYLWAEAAQKKRIDFVSLKIISDDCENLDHKTIVQNTESLMKTIKKLLNKVLTKI